MPVMKWLWKDLRQNLSRNKLDPFGGMMTAHRKKDRAKAKTAPSNGQPKNRLFPQVTDGEITASVAEFNRKHPEAGRYDETYVEINGLSILADWGNKFVCVSQMSNRRSFTVDFGDKTIRISSGMKGGAQ